MSISCGIRLKIETLRKNSRCFSEVEAVNKDTMTSENGGYPKEDSVSIIPSSELQTQKSRLLCLVNQTFSSRLNCSKLKILHQRIQFQSSVITSACFIAFQSYNSQFIFVPFNFDMYFYTDYKR